MKKRKTASLTVGGVLLFFLTNLVTVTLSVLVFARVNANENKGVIALVLLLVTTFLSLLWTLADLVRRKIMIDKPVQQILDATERIAQGNFTVRLTPLHPYPKYDEFDCIIENLNVLTEELGKSEILKTDFIANVSHELKTPLSVIQNYATALQAENLDEQTRKQYAKTLLSASKRLTDLVTNILKLNKLEHEKLKPAYTRYNLTEQLAQTILSFEDLLERKRITLSCDLEELELTSDPALLEIVWNNLLSNAVKFTNEGGAIQLSLYKRKEQIVVTVSDSGCGIPPETGKRIFDKFYQGDTSHASEGNGLGLALVKRVIDILGGEITVVSELHKGSTFTVALKDNGYAK